LAEVVGLDVGARQGQHGRGEGHALDLDQDFDVGDGQSCRRVDEHVEQREPGDGIYALDDERGQRCEHVVIAVHGRVEPALARRRRRTPPRWRGCGAGTAATSLLGVIGKETTIRYDAIVVGGGLVGAATAYELGRGGARTLLVDRHDRGRATDAGA